MQSQEVKSKSKVLCIMGPTAIGKTSLAIELYNQGLPIDIISVDSAMVYKGLDIGTGKPSKETLEKVPHALVDIRQPYEVYTVADFYQDVIKLVKQSHAHNRVPCLVGGTMMYFNALFKGLAKLPSSNYEVRAQIYNEINQVGLTQVYNKLSIIDPLTAKKVNSNDTQRIIRALEIFLATGQTLSDLLKQAAGEVNEFSKFNCINIIMAPENYNINCNESIKTGGKMTGNYRTRLHELIAVRFHEMLANGFIEEVQGLCNNPKVLPSLPAMKSCGYQQVAEYLSGALKYESMIEKSLSATRQLAKRQLTWLRSGLNQWPNTYWLNIFESDPINLKDKIIKLLTF